MGYYFPENGPGETGKWSDEDPGKCFSCSGKMVWAPENDLENGLGKWSGKWVITSREMGHYFPENGSLLPGK